MSTLLEKIKSVKLCLMAHPDNEVDSEFADRISDLEEIEKELSKDKWIKLNSEDDLPKTYKTIDLWFLTKTGQITINNWNSKFQSYLGYKTIEKELKKHLNMDEQIFKPIKRKKIKYKNKCKT